MYAAGVISAYAGCTVVMGTRHGKHLQTAPAFATLLGARVVAPAGLDTDRFGTFTGDRPRTLDPLAAARAKARLGMAATGVPFGLASEASYGPLPGLGWTGHEELLVFVDDTRQLEILEGERSLTVPGTAQRVREPDQLHLEAFGWPAQALIARPADGGRHAVTTAITGPDALATAVAAAVAASADAYAIVEPDLRAHLNPSRQEVLTRLARRLAARLATPCPGCRTPGFGRTGVATGLPCRECATPTDEPRADVHGCARCDRQDIRPRAERHADPRWCPLCNP